MDIPSYESCMDPVMQAVADGKPHRVKELVALISNGFNLSDEQREQLIPSGTQTTISNRVHWAKTYLTAAGLLESAGRGSTILTDEGRRVLASRPDTINNAFLKKYESFRDFKRGTPKSAGTNSESGELDDVENDNATPEEAIDVAYRTHREGLVAELLDRVKACSSTFFEQLVVKLLVAMGYGGTLQDAGSAVGKSGDEGIDGVIKEDRLGLDIVCIQAKKWENSVGRPEVQAFAGSMEGFRARKGVLITTSSFTASAREYVAKIERRIVLIDGRHLAEYMIDFGLGVTPTETYIMRSVDSDFFPESNDS